MLLPSVLVNIYFRTENGDPDMTFPVGDFNAAFRAGFEATSMYVDTFLERRALVIDSVAGDNTNLSRTEINSHPILGDTNLATLRAIVIGTYTGEC